MKKCILIAILALPLSGCVNGFVPGKDVEIVDGEITVASPWGTQVIKAHRLSTRVNPNGKNHNPMPPAAITNEEPRQVPTPAHDDAMKTTITINKDGAVTVTKSRAEPSPVGLVPD